MAKKELKRKPRKTTASKMRIEELARKGRAEEIAKRKPKAAKPKKKK